ncbi:hypothetical protein B0H12DRAFT_1217100 [Mycena haematopus]|nr:hypothetical protein B0H12DRAFT_1217100 [Mycena haematopus]
MATTLFPMRAILLEQKERISKSSKTDVERFIEESELKITSLESQISALVELRDRERACVDALRNLISPIHTLPVELLAEIFELAIGEDDEAVFRISQVCSDWRQVAHSTPRLWATDTVVYLRPSRSGEEEQVYMAGVKALLVRSAPLTIGASLVLEHGRKDHCIPDEVLETAPRWCSLHLSYSPDYASPSFISQLTECKLESLEELSLGRLNENVDPTALPSFTTVPRLRKLRIHLSSNALPIFMPWVQLTDLNLRADLPNIALDVLGQCPNLIRAAVSTARWDVLPEARQDIVALSRFHFLMLDFFGSEGHSIPFFGRLSIPALDNLCLDFGQMAHASVAWTQAGFTAFQLRAPNITQLELKYSPLTSDDLRTVLHHAPSLTSLQITFCYACIDDPLINALCYKADVSPLVPNLRILCLAYIGDNFTKDILGSMIASRWWTDTELALRLIPPAVSRWTRVELWGGFDQHVIDIVKNLSSDLPIF